MYKLYSRKSLQLTLVSLFSLFLSYFNILFYAIKSASDLKDPDTYNLEV